MPNSASHQGRLDEKGRCCGRKPLVYKPERFCVRCDRAFDLETGEQIPNWAWKQSAGGAWECQTNRKEAK